MSDSKRLKFLKAQLSLKEKEVSILLANIDYLKDEIKIEEQVVIGKELGVEFVKGGKDER